MPYRYIGCKFYHQFHHWFYLKLAHYDCEMKFIIGFLEAISVNVDQYLRCLQNLEETQYDVFCFWTFAHSTLKCTLIWEQMVTRCVILPSCSHSDKIQTSVEFLYLIRETSPSSESSGLLVRLNGDGGEELHKTDK